MEAHMLDSLKKSVDSTMCGSIDKIYPDPNFDE